ncbi:hypothetical protein N780_03840 [Pontibacillus chungwhensis BH030062]|uniref:DUF4937 domain-containing protein n=1 Tax=Pontibacillus chungwhensis BH030062 TaxID=1385513 RepID=A0A0A2V9Z8_9BACI|nr:DUF4937 domain-containing protein [Pontibacillus chungwhensis]KGP90540.1 hypothetical protein N780_03840 [Pontibacillus chungwhensis BH030062]
MILKRIKCHVPVNLKESFQEAQTYWSDLSEMDGFSGQFGGWDSSDLETAYIFSFWEDLSSYQKFMRNMHDRFVQNNGQERTYDGIWVTLYHRESPLVIPPFAQLETCSISHKSDLESRYVFSSINNKSHTISLAFDTTPISGEVSIQLEKSWNVERL